MRSTSASPTFKPPMFSRNTPQKFSAPAYSSGGFRADVLVIMARRFPIARLFGVRFREFDLQIDHFNCLYVDAIQILRIESVSLACRDMATHNRVHLLLLFLGQLVYQLQRVT